MALLDHWPLFGLRVRTPRLELRYPDDELIAEVADIAALGIHDPGFRPFLHAWDEVPPPQQQRNTLRFLWNQRSSWTPTSWHCGLVVAEGVVAGVQGLLAEQFSRRRTVQTGTWLGRAHPCLPFFGAVDGDWSTP